MYPQEPRVIHRRRTTTEEWTESPGPMPALEGVEEEQLDDEPLDDGADDGEGYE